MPFRLFIISLALLASTSVWAQGAGKQVLFDFRSGKYPVPAKVAPAVEKKVLDAIFPKYFKNESECDAVQNAPADLAQKRNMGYMVPTVMAAINGSFTAAGANQTAYLIQVRECGASHAENFGSRRIAIFSGDQLAANVELGLNDYLASVKLAGGLTGLLLSGGWTGQGVIQSNATVYGFAGGKLVEIRSFGTVDSSNCEMASVPDHKMQVAVLYVTDKGGSSNPDFSQEFYQSKCPANGSTPSFQPFAGPVESY